MDPKSGPQPATGSPAQDGEGQKKSKGKKRKRNALPKDPNAPKRPLTAYQVFFSEMRPNLLSRQPDMRFPDISRSLASQWTSMNPEEKTPYLETSERDRERYMKDFLAYQLSDSYKQFMKLRQEGVASSKGEGSQGQKESSKQTPQSKASLQPSEGPPPSSKPTPLSSQQGFVPGTDIPIFTEQFLQHNREMESELRKLRHTNLDLEEENALLSRHVDNMRAAVAKLQSETESQLARNSKLKEHLQTLRESLTAALQDTPLPGLGETPTVDTIDSFVGKLQVAIATAPEDHGDLVEVVREVEGRVREEVRHSEQEEDVVGDTVS